MDSPANIFHVYNELADWYEQKGPPSMRDRFLALAADAALTAGDVEVAEYLWERLLQFNPHHLLKPYATFVQATGATDVQTYLGELRSNYPPAAAHQLLLSLRGKDNPTAHAIPPTAPLIHFDDDEIDKTAHLEPAPELLKVYPLHQEEDHTELLPPRRPARPALDETPPPRSGAPSRPTASGPTTPAPRGPATLPRTSVPPPPPVSAPRRPPVPPPPSEEPDEPKQGNWLGVVLCGVIVVVGMSFGGYSLLRPFLPTSWLP